MTLRLAQFGTFDVDNLGDVLFPAILERELERRLGPVELTLYSPIGGALAGDARRTIRPIQSDTLSAELAGCDALVVGGGDLLSFRPLLIPPYLGTWEQAMSPHTATWAAPSLACPEGVPIAWNAPGVPYDFTPEEAPLVRSLAATATYRAIRDEGSRARLAAAGVTAEVVPDSLFALGCPLPRTELEPVAQRVLQPLGLRPGEVLLFQAGPASIRGDAEPAWEFVRRTARALGLRPVLLSMGRAVGDADALRRVREASRGRVPLLEEALAPRERIALIAAAGAFVGSSLHGNVIAYLYAVPQLVLQTAGIAKLEGFLDRVGRRDLALRDWGETKEPDAPGPLALAAIGSALAAHFDRLAAAVSSRPALGAWGPGERDLARLALDLLARRHGEGIVGGPPAGDPTPRPAVTVALRGRPAVSVILPVYNGQRCLSAALASVQQQTLPPVELLVVDDGSVDASLEAVGRLAAPFPVRVLRQPNQGQSAARNHGARVAQGELFAFLDQDDEWRPHHLQALVPAFVDRPALAWAYSDFDEIDGHGAVVTHDFLRSFGVSHPKQTILDCVSADLLVLPSASVLRRSAFEQVGGFDEDLCGYEDDDLFVRLFRAGWRHLFVPTALTRFRIHGGSSSASGRFLASRLRYADKLTAMLPDDERLGRCYLRDAIAPRFFYNTLDDYVRACSARDWPLAQRTLTALRRFARERRPQLLLRCKLACAGKPRLFRALMAINDRLPAPLRWRGNPAVRLRG